MSELKMAKASKDEMDGVIDFFNGLEIKKLYKTEDWQEDFGDCLFFYFPSFEEPPKVSCTTPLSSDFKNLNYDDIYTHFIRLDFNDIFEQADKDFPF